MRNVLVALAAALALVACTRPNDHTDTAVAPQADLAPGPSAPDLGGPAAGGDMAGAPQGGDDMAQAPAGDLAQAPAADMAQACGGAGQPCCYTGGGLGFCGDGASHCMGQLGAPDTVHGGYLCGGSSTERCVRMVASNCGAYPYSGCTLAGAPNGAYCEAGLTAPASGPEAPQGGVCQTCSR